LNALRLAVIGAGHLGRIHAKLLSEMSDVTLVAVVDPIAAVRDQVAAAHRAESLAEHHTLLDRVDAAVIATPTRHHHQVAMDFLEHGIPLLIEKPLAADLAEADAMVHMAERSGTLLQVGHIERFNPAFTAATRRVNRPSYVEAVRASGYTGRSIDIGVVYDLMIHDLDLVLSLVGAPLARVEALGLAILGRHEDVAQARLTFANGAVANLSASRVSFASAPKRQMQLWSAQGFATIDFGNRSAQVVIPDDAIAGHEIDFEQLDTDARAQVKERLFSDLLRLEPLEIESRNALADELRDFCDSIREQRSPRVTGRHGRDAVAAAEAILHAIRTHAWDGNAAGQIGPLAAPAPSILRGPHWRPVPTRPIRREAG